MIIESVVKAFRLLELFAPDDPELTLSELASGSGMTLGSVQRLVATLQHVGMIERDGSTKRYRLSPKTMIYGRRYLQSTDLQRSARSEMEALAAETSDSVNLAVRSGRQIIYVHRLASKRPDAPQQFWAGTVLPVELTAMGKVLLAYSSDEECAFVLDSLRFPLQRSTGTVNRAQFRTEITEARTAGFAVADKELRPDVRSIAAPVRDENGNEVAALGVSSSPNRDSDLSRFVSRLRSPLLAATRRISLNLGFAFDPIGMEQSL